MKDDVSIAERAAASFSNRIPGELTGEEREQRKRDFVLNTARRLRASGASSDALGFIKEAQKLRAEDAASAGDINAADALAVVQIVDLLNE